MGWAASATAERSPPASAPGTGGATGSGCGSPRLQGRPALAVRGPSRLRVVHPRHFRGSDETAGVIGGARIGARRRPWELAGGLWRRHRWFDWPKGRYRVVRRRRITGFFAWFTHALSQSPAPRALVRAERRIVIHQQQRIRRIAHVVAKNTSHKVVRSSQARTR